MVFAPCNRNALVGSFHFKRHLRIANRFGIFNRQRRFFCRYLFRGACPKRRHVIVIIPQILFVVCFGFGFAIIIYSSACQRIVGNTDCDFSPLCRRTFIIYGCQVISAPKCILLNIHDLRADNKRRQIGFAVKCIRANGISLVQRNRCFRLTICILYQRYSVFRVQAAFNRLICRICLGYANIRQAVAIGKCQLSNLRNAAADGNARQVRTSIERARIDIGYAVGNGNARHCAIAQRVFVNARNRFSFVGRRNDNFRIFTSADSSYLVSIIFGKYKRQALRSRQLSHGQGKACHTDLIATRYVKLQLRICRTCGHSYRIIVIGRGSNLYSFDKSPSFPITF